MPRKWREKLKISDESVKIALQIILIEVHSTNKKMLVTD
jgi:hypothetical protein